MSSWSRSKLVAPMSAWSCPAPSPASRISPASSSSCAVEGADDAGPVVVQVGEDLVELGLGPRLLARQDRQVGRVHPTLAAPRRRLLDQCCLRRRWRGLDRSLLRGSGLLRRSLLRRGLRRRAAFFAGAFLAGAPSSRPPSSPASSWPALPSSPPSSSRVPSSSPASSWPAPSWPPPSSPGPPSWPPPSSPGSLLGRRLLRGCSLLGRRLLRGGRLLRRRLLGRGRSSWPAQPSWPQPSWPALPSSRTRRCRWRRLWVAPGDRRDTAFRAAEAALPASDRVVLRAMGSLPGLGRESWNGSSGSRRVSCVRRRV